MSFKVWLLVLVTVGGSLYVWNDYTAPCKRPLAYDVGTIDLRQSYTRDEFLALIQSGEKMWEKNTGRDLFVYKPGSLLKVNLLYDQRQQSYNIRKNEVDSLGITEANLANEKNNLDQKQATYETNVAAYNREVNRWNGRGGAPKNIQSALENQRILLENDKKTLQDLVTAYNASVREYNAQVGDLNALAHEETTAGEARQGDEINVFVVEKTKNDTTLLAHELGHALGLAHVSTDNSIMYYRLPQGLTSPSQADLSALNNLCSS
jgi:hypothetical protein